jgi:tetratricopeptide (TPR) repeat protein
MKRILTLIFLLLLMRLVALSQPHSEIHGRVILCNIAEDNAHVVNPQYIAGAAITSMGATPTASDALGRFTLQFPKARMLQTAYVQVEKHGLVLVNARELLAVTIGSVDTIEILMTDSASLAQEQQRLFDIHVQEITVHKERIIAQLRSDSTTRAVTLAALQDSFDREFLTRQEAEDFLEAQVEALQHHLPEHFARLALLNLEFASGRRHRAYEFLHEGKVEQALSVLEGMDSEAQSLHNRLDSLILKTARYEDAKQAIDDAGRQILGDYRFKSELHELQFEYRLASVALEKAVALLLKIKRGKMDLEVAGFYGDMASCYRLGGDYDNALHYQEMEVKLDRTLLGTDSRELCSAYNDLALILRELGKFKEALAAQWKDIRITEKRASIDLLSLGTSYNNVAMIHGDLGENKTALAFQLKAIELLKKSGKSDEGMLATCYNNLSANYSGLGELANAIAAQEIAIQFMEASVVQYHPDLATCYNNMALLLKAAQQRGRAKAAQDRAIAIYQQSLGHDHPALGIAYLNLSIILNDSGDFAGAKKAVYNATAIWEKSLEADHYYFAAAYNSLGNVHYLEGRLDSAAIYKERAVSIMERVMPAENQKLLDNRREIALLHEWIGDEFLTFNVHDSAIAEYQIALQFDSSNARLYFSIGLCQYYLGEYEAALASSEMGFQLNSKMVDTYLERSGIVLSHLGRYPEAKKQIRRLQRRTPTDYRPYRAWVIYYARQGDYVRAIYMLEKAIRKGYGDWYWINVDDFLAPLRRLPDFERIRQLEPS